MSSGNIVASHTWRRRKVRRSAIKEGGGGVGVHGARPTPKRGSRSETKKARTVLEVMVRITAIEILREQEDGAVRTMS